MKGREGICETIRELYETDWGNVITPEAALEPGLAGVRIFDEPLVGFGSADDELFEKYKITGVIGPWHMSPREWLPAAETVIALFFPFSETIRAANRAMKDLPAPAWLHGRIEGQDALNTFVARLKDRLAADGTAVCVPSADPRWAPLAAGRGITGYLEIDEQTFGSRWSERHAAYVCGLGTFALSKGLITAKGIAGRFGSLLTEEKIDPDPRPYEGIYDYCIRCGACVGRCPVEAISLENGKDHHTCWVFQEEMKVRFAPRYGCGLCQTGVPCECADPSA